MQKAIKYAVKTCCVVLDLSLGGGGVELARMDGVSTMSYSRKCSRYDYGPVKGFLYTGYSDGKSRINGIRDVPGSITSRPRERSSRSSPKTVSSQGGTPYTALERAVQIKPRDMQVINC